MHSSLIGKVEKAKRYALETERITFTDFSVKFKGENDNYITGYKDGKWHCTCQFFSSWGMCSHTMTLQKVLAEMLASEALSPNAR